MTQAHTWELAEVPPHEAQMALLLLAVDRDFFLASYPAPLFELGIQHKDMLRLAIDF